MSQESSAPEVSPGHPDYRLVLPGGLAVRWSTPEDRAGIARELRLQMLVCVSDAQTLR